MPVLRADLAVDVLQGFQTCVLLFASTPLTAPRKKSISIRSRTRSTCALPQSCQAKSGSVAWPWNWPPAAACCRGIPRCRARSCRVIHRPGRPPCASPCPCPWTCRRPRWTRGRRGQHEVLERGGDGRDALFGRSLRQLVQTLVVDLRSGAGAAPHRRLPGHPPRRRGARRREIPWRGRRPAGPAATLGRRRQFGAVVSAEQVGACACGGCSAASCRRAGRWPRSPPPGST